MARPEVSVIICVRNGARTIRRQLDALDAQVDHPPFEVIVVDNGSTDDTVAVVERWLRERGPVDAPGHLVDASTRPGIPYARNQGALAARGRLLAYCDADDRVHPRWVGAMHRALARDGIVGGRIEGISPSGKPLPHTFPHGLNVTEYLPHAGNCNLAITRACFVAIGGYDESLPRYGFEDVDLCWRAQEQGFPIHYAGDAILYFSVSTKVAAVRKEYLIAQGRVAMARRHPAAFRGFTLTGSLLNLGAHLAAFPWRMIRPGSAPRSRHVRHLVDAAGFVVGYLRYGRGDTAPRLLQPSQFDDRDTTS